MILGREPALIAGFIQIGLNLLVSFGLHLTVEQVVLLNALTVAGLSIVVRQQVTPVANPHLPSGTTVMVTTPDGEGNKTKVL